MKAASQLFIAVACVSVATACKVRRSTASRELSNQMTIQGPEAAIDALAKQVIEAARVVIATRQGSASSGSASINLNEERTSPPKDASGYLNAFLQFEQEILPGTNFNQNGFALDEDSPEKTLKIRVDQLTGQLSTLIQVVDENGKTVQINLQEFKKLQDQVARLEASEKQRDASGSKPLVKTSTVVPPSVEQARVATAQAIAVVTATNAAPAAAKPTVVSHVLSEGFYFCHEYDKNSQREAYPVMRVVAEVSQSDKGMASFGSVYHSWNASYGLGVMAVRYKYSGPNTFVYDNQSSAYYTLTTQSARSFEVYGFDINSGSRTHRKLMECRWANRYFEPTQTDLNALLQRAFREFP